MNRYIVFLKQVPLSTRVEMDTETKTLKRSSAMTQTNPNDLYALQAALDVRRRTGGEVVAVTMGPPSAEEVLREALQRGADRAVLLTSRAFAGSDTWCTSLVLAAAARRLGSYTLLFFGKMAIDGDTAQVGPEVAAHLQIPQVTSLQSIDGFWGQTLRVTRCVDEGLQRLDVDLSCVVVIGKEWGTLDNPTLAGWRRAQQCPITCWDEHDLELPASEVGLLASPTRVVSTEVPDRRKDIRWLADSLALSETIKELVKEEKIKG